MAPHEAMVSDFGFDGFLNSHKKGRWDLMDFRIIITAMRGFAFHGLNHLSWIEPTGWISSSSRKE
jgi:hypothetical protein